MTDNTRQQPEQTLPDGLLRHEDYRLITGTGKFTADWHLEGQLHAAMIRSDVAHADITSIDLAATKASPGVVCVLTAADVAAAGFNTIPTGPDLKSTDGTLAIKHGLPILADKKVCFVGQPIAMVVASTKLAAEDAAALASIEYKELPVASNPHKALADDAPLLHEGTESNLSLHFEHGDKTATDAAFDKAAHTTALTIKSQRLIGAPMEPRACGAQHDPASGITRVYTPMQGLNGMRGALSAITGIGSDELDVIAEDVGGSFGVRSGAYPEAALAVLACRKLEKPVKWVASRSELFIGEWHGRGLELQGELALDADYNITAIRFSDIVDLGAYNAYFGGFIGTNNLWVTMGGAYRVPALSMQSKLVWTNALPVSAYRGAGRPDIAFAIERLIDHACAEFGLDAIAFRKQNFIATHEFPYATANGSEYDCGDFHSVLDKALELAQYEDFPARAELAHSKGLLRGIGVGYYIEKSGAGGAPKDQVSCRFEANGTLQLYGVSGPSGQGHETAFAQIVGERLGIAQNLIGFTAGDASKNLVGNGTGGSRSLYGTGSAFRNLADKIIRIATPLAAQALQADESTLSFENGVFKTTDNAGITLTELAAQLRPDGDTAHPFDTEADTVTGANYPNGCHLAEIEINPETGVSRVVTYTAVDDLGNVVNPVMVEGQIHGGVVQGVGQAFNEEVVYDNSGQLLSGSFIDYAMPRAGSIDEFRIGSHPVPTALNELGAKGVGESGCSGSLPAISNAMMHALRSQGVGPIDMPYTPQKVWQALRDKQQ